MREFGRSHLHSRFWGGQEYLVRLEKWAGKGVQGVTGLSQKLLVCTGVGSLVCSHLEPKTYLGHPLFFLSSSSSSLCLAEPFHRARNSAGKAVGEAKTTSLSFVSGLSAPETVVQDAKSTRRGLPANSWNAPQHPPWWCLFIGNVTVDFQVWEKRSPIQMRLGSFPSENTTEEEKGKAGGDNSAASQRLETKRTGFAQLLRERTIRPEGSRTPRKLGLLRNYPCVRLHASVTL